MSDDGTPSDPPPPLVETPPAPAGKSSFMEIAGRGCLGVVSFLFALVAFASVMAASQPIGLVVSVALVVALFVARRRSGPSPMLGAVVFGVAVALVLTGLCTIIVMTAA